MNRLRSQAGVSLLEVLSSLALFAVVASGLTSMNVSNIKLNNSSKTTAAATALMQNKIEQIRAIVPVINVVPADLTIGTHNDPGNPMTALGEANGTFTRTWTVTAVPQYLNGTVVGVRPGMVQVVVKVRWSKPVAGTMSAVTYACTTSDCG
jgi:prepilin-type N-terminal cleavage/methylation domain-containing protein